MSTRRRLGRLPLATTLTGVVIAVAVAGGASGDVIVVDNCDLDIEGEVKPQTLPRKGGAPVRLRLGAHFGKCGADSEPALKRMVVDLDRAMRIDGRGLARCTRGRIRDTRTDAAERACGDALVGRGRIDAVIEPEDQAPLKIRGPMLAFNGPRRGGLESLVFHVFARTPAPSAFVSAAKVGRARGHRFGRRLRIDLPQFGGDGRVTGAFLRLNRRWRYRGEGRSYVRASCRHRRLVGMMRLQFRDVDDLIGGFTRPCRVRS